jgi:hypothetical protein
MASKPTLYGYIAPVFIIECQQGTLAACVRWFYCLRARGGLLLQLAVMRKRYKRNKLLRETAEAHAAYLRLRGPFKQLADDDGSLTAEAQQQRQARLDSWQAALQQHDKHRNPPSPTLQGLDGAAAAARPQQGLASAAAAAPPHQQQQRHDVEDSLFDDDDDEHKPYTRAPPQQRSHAAAFDDDGDDDDDDDDDD